MSRSIRIATRNSKLAIVQANMVKSAISEKYPESKCHLVEIITSGDRIQDQSLMRIGGKGLFVKEIESALLCADSDIAVHSMKDVPAFSHPDLCFPAVLERDDPRDVLISKNKRDINSLDYGATVATSAPRRAAILKHMNRDFSIVPIRGNVNTRLCKFFADTNMSAMILAHAGILRLKLDIDYRILDFDTMLPAANQGIIGIQCRRCDSEIISMMKNISHQETYLCMETERAFLKMIGGDCHTPTAAFARIMRNKMHIACMLEDDGKFFTNSAYDFIEDRIDLGERMAESLLHM